MRPFLFAGTILLAGLLTLLTGAAPATAEEATATTFLNVRSGPGTAFSVIDTLEPGEVVDMTECQPNGWCYVTHDGPDGWVSSTYLTAAPGAGSPGSDCRFELAITADGPEFRIVCGDGGAPAPAPEPEPAPTPVGDQACFYDLPNFSGDGFCRGAVTLNSLPPAADDRITSVLLSGAAQARLCADPNMSGFCRTVTASEGQLGGMLNDRVSSLRVSVGAPAPSGPPVTHSSATRSLPETRRLNLDNGNIGMAGADIWYRAHNPEVRRLVPINGAALARGDGSNRGFSGCSGASFSTSPLPFAALPVGTYVCARTSEGRISQFRVNGFSGTTLNLGYTTWAN